MGAARQTRERRTNEDIPGTRQNKGACGGLVLQTPAGKETCEPRNLDAQRDRLPNEKSTTQALPMPEPGRPACHKPDAKQLRGPAVCWTGQNTRARPLWTANAELIKPTQGQKSKKSKQKKKTPGKSRTGVGVYSTGKGDGGQLGENNVWFGSRQPTEARKSLRNAWGLV